MYNIVQYSMDAGGRAIRDSGDVAAASWDVQDFNGDGEVDFLACTGDPHNLRSMRVSVGVSVC